MNFAILGEIGAKPISIGIGWHTHFGLVEIQEVTALFWKVMFVLALHQTLLTQRHFIKGYKVTSLHTSKSGVSSNPAAILVSDLVGSVTYMLGLFIELPWQCPPSLSFPKFIFLHKMKTTNISNFNVRCAGFRLPKMLHVIYEHLIAMSVMHQRKHLCFNT